MLRCLYFYVAISRCSVYQGEHAMDEKELQIILSKVASGEISTDKAVLSIKQEPFHEMGFARIDNHRGIRQGVSEVIYGAGKTKEQIYEIVKYIHNSSKKPILITRMAKEAADYLQKDFPLSYDSLSKVGIIGEYPEKDGKGTILVVTAGTSDIPVAEEAAKTAEVLGNKVERLYDVGVAGIHRLLSHTDQIMTARVIIAVAGMEGALASVVGGLANCPIIAVPTSVGYGANFGGLSALLSMLNSCASGVSVVNIDNGFGAGYQANMINHL